MIYNKEINQTNINSAQIYWKVTYVKRPKGTVAIAGDSIVSVITEELLKTEKHDVKARFLLVELQRTWKIILSLSREENRIILFFMSQPATQQI